jgi:glutathione S-transferase
MIKVYGQAPSRAVRVLWMLEEMDLPHEVHAVDFPTRLENAAFMALNPAGTLPAFVDGDVVIADSTAAVAYLAARYGPTPLAPDAADPAFPLYQQFLHFGESSLGGLFGGAIAARYFAPEDERDNWGGRFAFDLATRRTALVTHQLEKTPYVAGDRFTAADISIAYALTLWDLLDAGDRLSPTLQAYLARMKARPAYQRACAA